MCRLPRITQLTSGCNGLNPALPDSKSTLFPGGPPASLSPSWAGGQTRGRTLPHLHGAGPAPCTCTCARTRSDAHPQRRAPRCVTAEHSRRHRAACGPPAWPELGRAGRPATAGPPTSRELTMLLISKICFWNKNHISIFIFKFRQGFFFFFFSSQFSLHMGEANPLAVTDRSSDSTVQGKKRRINDSSTGETFLQVFQISLSPQPVITDAKSLKSDSRPVAGPSRQTPRVLQDGSCPRLVYHTDSALSSQRSALGGGMAHR